MLDAVAEIDQLGVQLVEVRDKEMNARVAADVWASGKLSMITSAACDQGVVGGCETRLASLQGPGQQDVG